MIELDIQAASNAFRTIGRSEAIPNDFAVPCYFGVVTVHAFFVFAIAALFPALAVSQNSGPLAPLALISKLTWRLIGPYLGWPQIDLENLLTWPDPKRKPLLVQLPEAEHVRLTSRWKLPPAFIRSERNLYCPRSSNFTFRIGYSFQSL